MRCSGIVPPLSTWWRFPMNGNLFGPGGNFLLCFELELELELDLDLMNMNIIVGIIKRMHE